MNEQHFRTIGLILAIITVILCIIDIFVGHYFWAAILAICVIINLRTARVI